MNEMTLLFIDDDDEARLTYSDHLETLFGTVITAENGKEGFAKFLTHHPDFIITDMRMPDMNGPELIRKIRQHDTDVPIVVLSAYVNDPFLTESFSNDVNGILSKPAKHKAISALIKKILLAKEKSKELDERSAILATDKLNDLSSEMFGEISGELSSATAMMVVGIGASAGGLEALTSLISGLPKKNNTAYVLAQHLSPTHKTMLVDLLSRETTMLVKSAENGETLESDIFYITPPNKNIEIDANNCIVLSPPDKHSFLPKPSVNRLLISIAEHKKDKAIGIILSGTGTDGAQGMRAINSEGGITFVQKPGSEKYDGMPMASINGCHVDIVIEPEKIGQELVAIANFPRKEVLKKHQLTQKNDDITTIYNLLYSYKKVDFSLYKKTTIGRRIERRMVALKVINLSDYVTIITEDKREVEFLYKDILIGVTKFFRDPEAFAALEEKINNYLDDNPDAEDFRVWVAGSSTGEEAYSLLITIQELLNKREQNLAFRVFATDIDEDAIQIARKGIYSQASMVDVKKEYIERYFTIHNDEFEIQKELREKVVFSFHNLLADPPFKQLDLVVCRNLLIYINLEAQKYVMPTFHYSLNTNGLLFLGMSENATNYENYFAPIDKQNKIFKSVPVSKRNYKTLPLKISIMTQGRSQEHYKDGARPPIHELVVAEASKLLMPNIIVANEQLEVIYKKGKFDYVAIPEGYVTYNLYKIIDPRLSIDLRKLVSTSNAQNSAVATDYIPLPMDDDQFRFLKIHLVPVLNNRSKIFIFYFEEISNLQFPHLDNKEYDASSNRLLELELHRTKEHMQTLIEEMETTNEELQSTNEELQSSNEELQSTNEEMETSNEELQSTNEELHIAYAELKEIHRNNTTIKNDLASLNRRYESILDNINDAVVVTNKNGFILRTNDAMQKLTGCSKERLLTERWNDYFNLDDQTLAKERFEKLMSDGHYGRYQLTLSNKDHEPVYLEAQDYLSKDDNGHTQIWTFASDITKELNALHRLAENEASYRATFEQANVGIGHLDLKGKWLKVNPSLTKTLGYSATKLIHLTLKEISHSADLESTMSLVTALIKGKKASDKLETRFIKKDGTIIWVALSVTVMKDALLKPSYLLVIIEDISPLKLAAEESAQAQAVFNYTQEAIIIVDENKTILSVNPAFELISGYDKTEVIGQHISLLKSERHTEEFYENMLRSIAQTGAWSGEFFHQTKSGEASPTHIAINSVKDEEDHVVKYVGVITDISMLVQSQAKIKHLANHDVLTDLPNRNLFNERLAHAISQARRAKKIIGLFFIDIDKFKVINDGLGHEVGDRVLINVAQRITNLLRENDTVARVGGDEFMVIVEELDSALDAGNIAQNIIDTIAKEMKISKHTVTVNASIGISLFPNDSIIADELIHKADLAMYEAKAGGRNTFCYTDKDLSSTALERATLYNAIRLGLNNHEFEIYFQPIVDCTTLEVSYLEALIRWNHPGLGLVLPGKFIPMAEGSELIIELTKFVIYEVFKTSHEMHKLNENFPPIAINYSLKVLKSDAIFHLFKKYMKQYDGHKNPPIIELTEREFIVSDEMNKQNLSRYKDLGIKFSMDDFGTGYSNLGYLIENPFDTLKIDRSFVSKIGKDVKSDDVIKATISIAKALRLKTVGEGIETKGQLEFLRENGCNFAQGFYLNMPVFISDLKDKLLSNGNIKLDKKAPK